MSPEIPEAWQSITVNDSIGIMKPRRPVNIKGGREDIRCASRLEACDG